MKRPAKKTVPQKAATSANAGERAAAGAAAAPPAAAPAAAPEAGGPGRGRAPGPDGGGRKEHEAFKAAAEQAPGPLGVNEGGRTNDSEARDNPDGAVHGLPAPSLKGTWR